MATLFNSGSQLLQRCAWKGVEIMIVRNRKPNLPRPRHFEWLPKPLRVPTTQNITRENKEFIQEVIDTQFAPLNIGLGMHVSPLKEAPIEPVKEWQMGMRRTGVIAKKIGVYPLWLKNGTKVQSTLLQVSENFVIKYIPPEEFKPVVGPKAPIIRRKLGCLVVGAERQNPQLVTKEYYNIFKDTGVMPTRILHRFIISPEAALQPGTPLFAAHFQPGHYVDVRGKTIDRGFQGVMKRWGFHGMPASHGVTKTHRRPGNVGSGSSRARVVPGTKMPGHMGNRWRVLRSVKVLRVNTKYNVIWLLGTAIPGETNGYCYIYDTLLPHKKLTSAPPFPTYLAELNSETLPENLYSDDVHHFDDPTITFEPEAIITKKK